MSAKERIIIDPDVLVGKPIIKGIRLSVEFVIDLLAQGWTEEDTLTSYPGVQREDILACFEYVSQMR